MVSTPVKSIHKSNWMISANRGKTKESLTTPRLPIIRSAVFQYTYHSWLHLFAPKNTVIVIFSAGYFLRPVEAIRIDQPSTWRAKPRETHVKSAFKKKWKWLAMDTGNTGNNTWNQNFQTSNRMYFLILPKTSSSPLKNRGWETMFFLGRLIFRGLC